MNHEHKRLKAYEAAVAHIREIIQGEIDAAYEGNAYLDANDLLALERVLAGPAPITVGVTDGELQLLVEALDSHEYWQLTEEHDRRDGYSQVEDGENPEIDACRALSERLSSTLQLNRPPTKGEVSDKAWALYRMYVEAYDRTIDDRKPLLFEDWWQVYGITVDEWKLVQLETTYSVASESEHGFRAIPTEGPPDHGAEVDGVD